MGETITPYILKFLRIYLKIFQEISVGRAEELGRGVARDPPASQSKRRKSVSGLLGEAMRLQRSGAV